MKPIVDLLEPPRHTKTVYDSINRRGNVKKLLNPLTKVYFYSILDRNERIINISTAKDGMKDGNKTRTVAFSFKGDATRYNLRVSSNGVVEIYNTTSKEIIRTSTKYVKNASGMLELMRRNEEYLRYKEYLTGL